MTVPALAVGGRLSWSNKSIVGVDPPPIPPPIPPPVPIPDPPPTPIPAPSMPLEPRPRVGPWPELGLNKSCICRRERWGGEGGLERVGVGV